MLTKSLWYPSHGCVLYPCKPLIVPDMSSQKLSETRISPTYPGRGDAVYTVPASGKDLPKEYDVLDDSLGYAIKQAQVRTYEVLFELIGVVLFRKCVL